MIAALDRRREMAEGLGVRDPVSGDVFNDMHREMA